MALPNSRDLTFAALTRAGSSFYNGLQDMIMGHQHHTKVLMIPPSAGRIFGSTVVNIQTTGATNWGWEFGTADTVGEGVAYPIAIDQLNRIISIDLFFDFVTAGTTGVLDVTWWRGDATGAPTSIITAATVGGTDQTVTLAPSFNLIAPNTTNWISIIIGAGWNRACSLKVVGVSYQRRLF
jgi:hypothetical protein